MQLAKFSNRFYAFVFAVTLFTGTSTLSAQHSESDAELSVKKLEVAPGLVVELFAAEPLLQNPVAFSIDEKGRFFIAETHRYKDAIFDITQNTPWLIDDLSFRKVEDRGAFLAKTFSTNFSILTYQSELVRLVEDRDGDGRAETSSIFASGFNETISGTAAGVLARHGEVWFTCIPDLVKISPSNSATQNSKSKIQKLSTGYGVHVGVSGHDLHGLAMGPDGKIYFSSGDRGFSVKTKEGKLLDYPDTGGVLRCNPDGADLEVFCIGLRNPQGLVFDEFGNLFTDDNDTAGPDDSRLLYLVEGGDYGWRCSYQHMEGYGPWVQENVWLGGIDGTLPYSGTVAQGPAGITIYPGTGLSEKYKNHFFACDFPKGVWSFTIKPKGASYELVEKEKFLWNLGPTHVEFGPDSNLYISDWGTAFPMPDKGRIYKISNPQLKNDSTVAEVKKLLSDGIKAKSVDELAKLLGHSDMRVRLEAQFETAKRGSNSAREGMDAGLLWVKCFRQTTNQLMRIHIIWNLASLGLDSAREAATELLKDSDSEIRAQTARWIGQTDWRDFSLQLFPLLHDASPRVRFFAASSLGKLKEKSSIEPILEMLRANADRDPYLTFAGFSALVNVGDFDAIQTGAKNKNVSVRRAALLAMRRMERVEISQFLKDADSKLILEAARAINDVPINDAMPQLAALLNFKPEISNPKWDEQILRRAINANFRLGETTNAVAIVHFIAQTNAPEAMRIEALNALSDWANTSQIDRVMGLWRPLPNRDIQFAQKAFSPVVANLLQSDSEKILVAVLGCARKLELKEISALLFGIFQNPKLAASVRIEALQTLATFKDKQLSMAVELALSDSNNELRREGIKWVEQIDAADAAPFLEKLLNTEKDLKLNQTILATLGQLKTSAADEILIRQLDQLAAGQLRPELQLDLLEASEKRNSPQVKTKLKPYDNTLSPKDRLARYRVTLTGGDAALGEKIFMQREDVACLRCHAIKSKGGTVGPDLAGIAAKHPREYLLESILQPNKQIAPGFESVALTMKNGVSYAGTVRSETDTGLVLNSPEDGILTLNKSDILKRDHSLSPMPEGMDKIISRRDLRDVIEFLSTLK